MPQIPEGICVAMPIYYATGSKWKVGGTAHVSPRSVSGGSLDLLRLSPFGAPPNSSVPPGPIVPHPAGLHVGQPDRVCRAAGRAHRLPGCARAGAWNMALEWSVACRLMGSCRKLPCIAGCLWRAKGRPAVERSEAAHAAPRQGMCN